MAACIAASISPVSGRGNVDKQAKLVAEDFEPFARPAVQSKFGEDFIHAYVMTAAGRDDSPAVASLLQTGVELSAASSTYKSVAIVPSEEQPVYVKAVQKGLHDPQEMVRSLAPQNYNGADREVPEEAINAIQILKEVVIEINNVNETCSEGNKRSTENYEKYLQIPVSTGDGNVRASTVSGDTEVTAVVLNDVAKGIEIERDGENSTFANVIPNERAEAPTNSLNVRVSPTESLHPVVERNGGAYSDDHEDFYEVGKEPAIGFKTEVNVALEHSDTTEVDEFLVENESYQICTSVVKGCDASKPLDRNYISQVQLEGQNAGADLDAASKVESIVDIHIFDPAIKVESKGKVEVSSTQAADIYEVDNVDTTTMISRSFSFTGLNHIAFCVESLERSLDFYCGLLGLKTNMDRPNLPYRGAWLFLGAEGIHLMEVPNPDPVNGRPPHGGYDRHACLNCKNVEGVRLALEKAGIPYQSSPVPSIFTRDPDGNGLEFIEVER